MKQIGSVTTIFPKAQLSKIGTQLGEHGSAMPEDLRAAVWLARHTPAEVDEAAVSRASSLGVGLKVLFDHRFPKVDRGNPLPVISVVRGCEVTGANRDEACAALRKFETPAPSRQIEAWLAELSVITAKRADDDFSEALRIAAYTARLSKYPADVAHAALLGHSWKFWPTWAEVQEICESLSAPRRAMILALSTARGSAPAMPEKARITKEQAEEIIREIYGRDMPVRPNGADANRS